MRDLHFVSLRVSLVELIAVVDQHEITVSAFDELYFWAICWGWKNLRKKKKIY